LVKKSERVYNREEPRDPPQASTFYHVFNILSMSNIWRHFFDMSNIWRASVAHLSHVWHF